MARELARSGADVVLTKTTALETAKEPITANALCPGYVLTPIVEKQIPDTMREYDMSREDVTQNVMLNANPPRNSRQLGKWVERSFFCAHARRIRSREKMISVDGRWTAL